MAAISKRSQLSCPLKAAPMDAVHPLWSFAWISTPAAISKPRQASLPFAAANRGRSFPRGPWRRGPPRLPTPASSPSRFLFRPTPIFRARAATLPIGSTCLRTNAETPFPLHCPWPRPPSTSLKVVPYDSHQSRCGLISLKWRHVLRLSPDGPPRTGCRPRHLVLNLEDIGPHAGLDGALPGASFPMHAILEEINLVPFDCQSHGTTPGLTPKKTPGGICPAAACR